MYAGNTSRSSVLPIRELLKLTDEEIEREVWENDGNN